MSVPDKRLSVRVIAKTPNPQQVAYAAMHQDYSSNFVGNETLPSEEKCGEIIIRRLLNAAHFGPIEHPQITFACGYFPHSVMQQARTHRVGCSFDCQSFRYTSDGIIKAAWGHIDDVEDAFYLRPVGNYSDRQGKKYYYSQIQRETDLNRRVDVSRAYRMDINSGLSEEHARGSLPFDYRQHFLVSFNARSLMHFFDMRAKKDAQLEIQWLCDLMFPHFYEWCPDIANWYKENRWAKGRLAP